MDKKEIKEQYLKKINLVNKYNKYYYDNSKPLVNDKVYDELKNDILLLEKKYSFLKSKQSPSETVGYKPSKSFKKVLHRAPMLSLANAFSEEDLLNFEKRIINFISEKSNFKISYSAEPKIDGLSLIPLIKGQNFPETYAFTETGNPLKERSPPKEPNTKSVRTSKWKLIYNEYNNTKELYNLEKDPAETNNLINSGLEIEEFLWNEFLRINNSM